MAVMCGMNGITSQFRQLVREHGQIKKKLKTMENSFLYMQKYLKHVEDIAKARQQVKKGQLIEQEKLFHDLGL